MSTPTAAVSRPRCLAALAAGATLPLAFAPFGWHPIAVLSLAILWWLWEEQAPRAAGWIGFAWGAGAFLTGTYWLYISIHVFGEAPLAVAIFLMLGLVAIMAPAPKQVIAASRSAVAAGRPKSRAALASDSVSRKK